MSTKPCFSQLACGPRGLRKRPSAILLVACVWMTQACTSEEEGPPANDQRDTADDTGGYELVIVDESAVSEGASTEAAGDDDRDDVEPAGIHLPGAVVFDREGDFTVQIGIYKDAGAARERVLELSKLGYPAYALGIRGESRVRVRIGYFTVREDAERFGEIFKEDTGSDYWVDRRSNEAP